MQCLHFICILNNSFLEIKFLLEEKDSKLRISLKLHNTFLFNVHINYTYIVYVQFLAAMYFLLFLVTLFRRSQPNLGEKQQQTKRGTFVMGKEGWH